MTGEPTEVEIVRLGAQGDGIAETPDGPVYVPFALPGERVRIAQRPQQNTGAARHASAHAGLVDLLTPSPDRQPAQCRHFQDCGGCVAQHMAARLYRDWKRDGVAQAFAHRGLTPVIAEFNAVPAGSRRRVSLEAVRRGDEIALGFHAAGTDRVVAISQCPVAAPAIVAALPALGRIALVLLAAGQSLHRSLDLTVTATPAGLDVTLDGEGLRPGAGERAELGRIAAASGIVRLTCNGELIVQSAVPSLLFDAVEVGLPPAAFIQATAEAEAAIAAVIAPAVAKARRAADLFAGIGTFSFALARRARVLAIDADAGAIAALRAAARKAQGLKPIETRVRDLLAEPLSRMELSGFDAVVFDPPRAGAKAQALMLARSDVPVVVAVSCNPATLARDVRILVDGGYQLDSVTPIDQFVWSAHVEAVAVLRRR